MDIQVVTLKQYVFPGRAGQMQLDGQLLDVVRELGDNYSLYHEQLAVTLDSLGGRPDPADYRDDFEAYCVASNFFVELIKAEFLLRRSYAARHRRGEDARFVDDRHRLVSILDDTTRLSRVGDPRLAGWAPPALLIPGETPVATYTYQDG